jgi:hypothetical protein
MTLVLSLVVSACGGVMSDEQVGAEEVPLAQVEQEYRCGFCGDGYCCPTMESSATCPNDCGQPFCGDGVCNTNTGESSTSCPSDCGPSTYCGDGSCNGGETSSSCPSDCGGPICGDGICSRPQEGNLNCPGDCPCGLERCW